MKPIAIVFFVVLGSSLLAQDAKTDAVYEKIISEYTLKKDGSTELPNTAGSSPQ